MASPLLTWFDNWLRMRLGKRRQPVVNYIGVDDQTVILLSIMVLLCPWYEFLAVLLIPEFCPEGQKQRKTQNESTLLIWNDSKRASKPIERPHSVPGPCIQQNSLFIGA